MQENTYRDRAAVFGDLDTDGDIDVIVAERHGAVRVLQNNANITDPFYVKLQGTTGNPKAIGATMRITFQDGSVVTRWLTDGSGFQSSSTPLQYVLPKGKTIIKIDIVWPNGEKQVVTEIPNEGLLTIGQ
jgi:hypothetical protein